MRDKRDRILAAATAVFSERDFHQVLVSEVAERAGVGKGTVYLYFPTKDHLHRGALEASLERLADEVQVRAKVNGQDPKQAAEHLRRNLDSLREHLTKRRQFLLAQEEIKKAGKFDRSELK